jgi:DNA/RNA-binding domain of Phe-tRNA-synthetase-like protein
MEFSKSPSFETDYPGLPFGLAHLSDCRNQAAPGFDQYKRRELRKMRKRENLTEISERIDLYDRFFKSFGFECPLPKHLRRTIHSGFPQYSLLVDAHFMAEMCGGILVAVADCARFEGDLMLDVAEEGETCLGMGERLLKTRRGEIVLRDDREIVCVLCQGADEKTRVREGTREVLFYAYAVPGILKGHLEEGLRVAAEAVRDYGGGKVERVEIY